MSYLMSGAYVKRGIRRVTSSLRPLPSVLIIGAMRSGTTSLFESLQSHPDVAMATIKEVHYFDIHFERGASWYRAFFNMRGSVVVDNTPSYMAHSEAAARASSTVPSARIVAVLRNPVERAWSHYRYRADKQSSFKSFEKEIQAEITSRPQATLEFSRPDDIPILSGGLYAEQLQPWIRLFGPERILIVEAEQLFSQSGDELARIQSFIGVSPQELPFPRANASPTQTRPQSLKTVEEFYEIPNRDLAQLVDTQLSWLPST